MISRDTRPLNNVQYELLKVMSSGVSDETLIEIRKLIANYLLEKAMNSADNAWDEKGYSEEKLRKMLEDDKARKE
ncbi:MAG: hypothetical protein ABI723_18365 [Bacteroidia bacterium]